MKRSLFQAACVAIPKGLGGALTVVLNGVLMTRLPPNEFGVYAISLVLIALVDAVPGAAIDMSAVKLASSERLHDRTRAAAIERWGVFIKLALSLAVVSLALTFAEPASVALFHQNAPELLLLVVVVATGVLLMRSLMMHLQLDQRFAAYAGLELLAQTLRVCGIGTVLLWFEVSALNLTIAAFTGTVLAVLGGLRIARLQPQPWTLPWPEGRALLRTLRWIFATFAVSSMLARVDLLLLARWSTIDQVGVFAAAQVYAQIPELLGLCLAVVFSPRLAAASAEGRLPELMRHVSGGALALAGVFALAGLALQHFAAPWLPPGYAASATAFLPLMVGALAGMVAMPLVVPYIMFTRPGFILSYDLLTLPLLLLAYRYAIIADGALGAAWVSGASRTLKALTLHGCAWHWARRHRGTLLSPSL